jgi:Dual specificity phosphatase, catalytic domain/Diguanylate cyclase, GGDEF domain
MHHIINNLWLGSQEDADALISNNPEQITAILNVRGADAYTPPGRDQSAEHPGKAYKWIPAPDIGSVSPKHVRWALSWLREQTEKGERILVHCKFGISRSPAILAAFMVDSGISPNLAEAKETISKHRAVQPASQIVAEVTPVVLVSALTGLPNRYAFEGANKDKVSLLVAVVQTDLFKVFNDSYGKIAGDALLRRLAKILIEVGLDAYHFEEKDQGHTLGNDRGNEFLCRGDSREDLTIKLSQARRLFRAPFQLYADGRIQTIEGADFSFAIGENLEDTRAALLNDAKKPGTGKQSPEWLRKIIETGGGKGGW